MKERNKRVLVGMSGGIDSTATCLMLQEQGYEIVGVTMRVWGDEPQDARELAARMGIEHYVADERIPFKETIVKNFIDEYKQGRTPNPCVMCNPYLNSVYWRNGPTSWTAPTLRPDITPGWKSGAGTSIL